MRSRVSPLGDIVASAAIVALAASAAWFALASQVDHNREAKCLTNLQRIAGAMRMYEDDYDGRLTPYVSRPLVTSGMRYTAVIAPYVGDITTFKCPADHIVPYSPARYAPYPTTYGMNWYISGLAADYGGVVHTSPLRSSVQDPVNTVCLSDCAVIDVSTAKMSVSQWREDPKGAVSADIYYFYLPWDAAGWSGSGLALVRPFPRHNGRLNVTFYDGHAETIPASKIPVNAADLGQPGCIWDNVAG